ncbi:putative ribonuclease H-like domain-containing protein [Tanacetum coccineum]
MLAIDGVGFDWSDMVEEHVQTNMALMVFSNSELNQTEFKASTYKRGLATVEEQLVTFRKNEVPFSEEVAILKREVACKDYEIGVLKTDFEKVKQEKEGIDFKIAKFDNASKSLDKLLESQITNNSKKGLGYHVIPSPHPLTINAPTKLDLSYYGLDEFKEPEFEGYDPRDTTLKSTIDSKENNDDSLIKEQVSKDENSSLESPLNVDKEIVFHAAKKINCPHHQKKRMVSGNNYKRVDYDYYAKISHPNTHRNMTPRAVLLKSGLTPLYTARPGKPKLNDKGFVDSGCSRHMTGNIAYLSNFKEFDRGYVTFGGGAYGGRITGKGTLKTDNLDFDVYFVNELKFNLFSVSQMCDKKNYVLFTDTECLILSPNLKLPDESQILLKIPRKDNMYSFDMKNIVLKKSLTCLVAKATLDESILWHRRLGHINFKNINKLVKDNLVRGLPTKRFENDQTYVACLKGKQHKASYRSKVLNPITKPLSMLHMDLFGPTFVSSLMHKKYCLVVTDDYSSLLGFFFLAKLWMENQEKSIRREYSVARTPQQIGVAERRNRTLIEAARTMVLVVKPHNKTPYELFRGFKPALDFTRPFGCHVTILNTLDNLGKFDGKSDEGFFVGYSLSSKAFKVYNTRTRKVEERLHIRFLENKPMIEGNSPKWLFDIDSLTQSMNYVPVTAETITNESAGTQGNLNAGTFTGKEETSQDYIVMPIRKDASFFDLSSKTDGNDEPKSAVDDKKEVEDGSHDENDDKDKSEDDSSPKEHNAAKQQVNTASPRLNTGSFELNTVDSSVNTASPEDMLGASHSFQATHVEFFNDEDEPEVDLGNIPNSNAVPTTPNTRIHKDHPIENVIGDMQSFVLNPQALLKLYLIHLGWKQCRKNFSNSSSNRQEEGIDYEEFFAPVARIEEIRLFLAYASFMGFLVYQMDVKSALLYGIIKEEVYVTQLPGFKDPDHPAKVYKVVKALYGLHQAPRACKKGDILLVQIYVDGIIFGSTNKELCTAFEKLMKDKFQMSSMGELTFFLGLQVTQKEDGIFISQDKFVAEILKKFNYTNVKSASTPVDLERPLVKDGDANYVDVHLYRSMIGSLMYLTASRPDIMFVACACARFQVTPKISHLLAVKRIFRYLKGKPILGLWYSKNSPFELVACTDSDYAGATQDRKLTTGGCQFFRNSTICIIENPVQHSKTKHIEIRHHFIRDCNAKKLIQMVKIDTEHNVANLLTKGFDAGRILRYLSLVVPLKKVGDKELGDRIERAATTTSSLEAEQETDAQTRFEAASKSPMIHLSQELTHLEVGRTEDAEIQEKNSADTEILLEEEEPTELVEDLSSGEKGEKEVTTADAELNTASASISTVSPSKVSTAEDISGAETLVYIRRSRSKDKGKAIMTEYEPKQPTIKLKLRQERAGLEATISYEDIAPIFERVWDQNHSFVPMDSELEVQRLKRAGQEVLEEPAKRTKARRRKDTSLQIQTIRN